MPVLLGGLDDAVADRRHRTAPRVSSPDNDLRELELKKNQYGPTGESIVFRYRHGLFLPEHGVYTRSPKSAAHRYRKPSPAGGWMPSTRTKRGKALSDAGPQPSLPAEDLSTTEKPSPTPPPPTTTEAPGPEKGSTVDY